MRGLTKFLDQRFYKEYKSHWDDLALRQKVLAFLNTESIVLDLGAGSGFVKEMNFRGLAKKIIGIDLDPNVKNNMFLDESYVVDGGALPFSENIFDLVISDNVLEHLESPHTVFSEIARILKPDGRLIVKTPNKWHYMSLVASTTPHWFHVFYNSLRGRKEEDTFKTLYRVNTPEAIEKCAQQAGLIVDEIVLLEGRPEYLRIFFIPYIFGLIYERIVNQFEFLSKYRIVIIAVLRKPAVDFVPVTAAIGLLGQPESIGSHKI